MKRILLVIALAAAWYSTGAQATEIGIAGFFSDAGVDEVATRRAVDDALDAVVLRYGQKFGISAGGVTSNYKLTVIASASTPTSPGAVTLKMEGPAKREETVYLPYAKPVELQILLPPAMFSLYARISGVADTARVEPPPASYEISLKDIKDLILPDPSYTMYSGGVAVMPDGIATAGMGFGARFDRKLSLRQVDMLDPKQPYAAAYLVASSPSGTFFVLTSTGDWYRKLKGNDTYEKAGSIQPLPLVLASTQDGGLIFQDTATSRFYKAEGRRKTELIFQSSAPTMMAPFGADGDGNLWTYDYVSQIVKVFEPSGLLIDAIRLLPPPEARGAPMKLLVRPSGGLLAISQTDIICYDRTGFPRWILGQPASAIDPDQVAMVQSAALSPADDALYVMFYGDYRITRFELNPPQKGSDTERLVEFNRAIAKKSQDITAHRARIELLEKMGAREQAYSCRLLFGDLFPGDTDNDRALAGYERAKEASLIKRVVDRVLASLQKFGPESARDDYSRALRAFEHYQASFPEDSEMAALRDDMIRAFREREDPGALPPPSARIAKARVDDLFPAFMERYRFIPAGVVTVENKSAKPLSGAMVRVSIKDFMDYPSESPWTGAMAPGASAEIPFFVLLNTSTLEIQEDITVQARVEVVFESAGAQAVSSVVPVVIRRRTAITWADSAAIASFITPNEDTIAIFARDAIFRRKAGGDIPFNRVFSKAVAVTDALGALGMAYVEDPRSPFTAVEGKPTIIDTVRFPRVTLAARVGDCDDTTALLASAFEATGIRTAILTTPGHILVAFATDEPEGALRRYAYAGYGGIAWKGEVWIPVETTVLAKGFTEAWRAGYGVWKSSGVEAELIPLAEARKNYPSLPLPSSPAAGPTPSIAEFTALSAKGQDRLVSDILLPSLAAAETVLSSKDASPDSIQRLNEAGVLAASFGRYDDAIRILKKAIAMAPGSVALRNNLYSALKMAGKSDEAAKALADALAAIPQSPVLERLAARHKAATDASDRSSRPADDAGGRGADADGYNADWQF